MILAPSKELEYIQKFIYENILLNVKVNDCAYGFKKGKSIRDNVIEHLTADKILNIDLKDFFPSIKAT